MEAFVVQGGRKLEGTIRVDGAKNAALPILAASVLTEETVVLQGVPSDFRRAEDDGHPDDAGLPDSLRRTHADA